MSESLPLLPSGPTLVFRPRPKPVPGDLRISWRLSLTVLALSLCRGKRASFVKLHILNDALRSEVSRQTLRQLVAGEVPHNTVTIRVEPAFSRALDLLVGEKLAKWIVRSGRLGVELTARGNETAKTISGIDGVFVVEKMFLRTTAPRITEQLVKAIVTAGAMTGR